MSNSDEGEFKSNMPDRSVFGGSGGRKKIVSLPPRMPDENLEMQVERSASDDLNFRHRGEPRKITLIPSAGNRSEDRGEAGRRTREDWVQIYEERLAGELQLQRPSESYRTSEKDRFAQVMPAYLSAALTTVSQANGFNKEWQLIEFMLEELGAFEKKENT